MFVRTEVMSQTPKVVMIMELKWIFIVGLKGERVESKHAEAAGHMISPPCGSPADGGNQIHLNYILYKVGVGTRCGEGKQHPDDGPDTFCSFPWAEMVVEDL